MIEAGLCRSSSLDKITTLKMTYKKMSLTYTFDGLVNSLYSGVATFTDGTDDYRLNIGTAPPIIATVPNALQLKSLTVNNLRRDPTLVPRMDQSAQYPFQAVLKCEKTQSGDCDFNISKPSDLVPKSIHVPAGESIVVSDSQTCPTVQFPQNNNNQYTVVSLCNGTLTANQGSCYSWNSQTKQFEHADC